MFKKKTKGISLRRKKAASKSRKIVKRKAIFSFSSSFYSSIIIFAGFITLSLTIFFLIRQLQPLINNEKLKFLCTYQLGDKRNQRYRDAKYKLEMVLGDRNKYGRNFLLPKEKIEYLDFFH